MNTPYKKALEKGDKYYFTGVPCKKGHIAKRNTKSGHCVTCEFNRDRAEYFKNKYQLDREKILSKKKKCRVKNPDKFNNKQRKYRKNNPEKNKKYFESSKKYQSDYYLINKDEIIKQAKQNYIENPEKHKKSCQLWRDKNKGVVNALRAKRRAAKLNRTPSWLTNDDKTIIKDMYAIASRVSKETGIERHVYHVIPLQGKLVSGLHTHVNLQLLTAKANLTKGNYFAVN